MPIDFALLLIVNHHALKKIVWLAVVVTIIFIIGIFSHNKARRRFAII